MFQILLKTKILVISLLLSVVFLVFSIVFIKQILPYIMMNELYKHVSLIKNTEQFDRFLETPFPITFKIYFFNIENSDQVLNGSKPLIKEIGPYVYKEYRKKTIVSTNDEEDTILYTQRETFKFDAESSGQLSDEDYITTLNTPMISMIQDAEVLHQAGTISPCLSTIFSDLDNIFITVKVKDILFDGLKFCTKKNLRCSLQQFVVCKIAETKRNIDKTDNGSLQFSFFNYKVKSDDGLYEVKRGIKDVKTLGNIVSLNNSTFTKIWKRSEANSCDRIKGTDSSLYPPAISKNSVFQIYSTDVCRSMEIQFLEETYYRGIKGYTFAPNNSTLRSSTSVKENDCFCVNKTKGIHGEDTCFLDGVIDIQPCAGAPVLLSFPHFLWADESYEEGIDGLNADEKLHRTFITIEPETGTPLEGMLRVQLNAVLRPVKKIDQLQKVPRVVLPLLWIEEGFSLSTRYIDELNEKYFDKLKIAAIVKWSLLGLSTFSTIFFSTYFVYQYYTSKKTQ